MTLTSQSSARPPIVIFSPNLWNGKWTSRHRIASGLAARGWPVIYTSGPLSLWSRGSKDWSASRLRGAVVPDRGLQVDQPGKLEIFHPGSARWCRLATNRHSARLRRHAMQLNAPGPLTAFLFHPAFWPNAKALRPDRLVYFSYDAFSLSPGWDSELAGFEREVVERADLIAAYSAAMFDYMPERARRVGKEIPTGVDFDHFAGAQGCPCPADLASIPSPRIGYAGTINQKLDFALMAEVARRSPEMNFVFIGATKTTSAGEFDGHPSETEAWKRMQSLPNVHYLGPRRFSAVPAYMMHMDVNIMCYRIEGGWWQAGYPLKMHEYLATGKPVVSTALPAILPFANVIDIAADADAWKLALRRALLEGGIGTPEARKEVARANSWDHRLDTLSHWIDVSTRAVMPAA